MKAVAIPYVIALVLGVVIISIIGYWAVIQSGKTSSSGLSADCQGKLFSYCTQRQNSGSTSRDILGDCPQSGKTDVELKTLCNDLGFSIS